MKVMKNLISKKCKYCGKLLKRNKHQNIRAKKEWCWEPKRDTEQRKYCSQKCYKLWEKLTAQTPEEKRLKVNKYQKEYIKRRRLIDPEYKKRINKYVNEYYKRKRLKDPKYQLLKKKKISKRLVKILKRYLLKKQKIQERIEKKTYKCKWCDKTFYDKHNKKIRKYCSCKCQTESSRKWKNAKECRRMHRRNGNGGIKKMTFDKMRAGYGYKCAICRKNEPFFDQYWWWLTQDHWVARGNGGKKRSKENIVPVCWNCNINKSNKVMNIPKPLPILLLSTKSYSLLTEISENDKLLVEP